MKMPIFPDALITALLGYAVVFAGLIMLMAVIALMGKVMNRKKAAVPQAAAPQTAPAGTAAQEGPVAPGSAGQLKLHSVPDRDAALIMAIVADNMGVPLNQLRFQSIKEVK